MHDAESLEDAEATLTQNGYDVVRVGYCDIIGTERGRDVLVSSFARTVGDGIGFCRTVYGISPMGDVVPIKGSVEAGEPDMLAFPDLSTLKPLPWEPGVAHCIADVYNPDGSPSQDSPRHALQRVAERFAALDMGPVAGPELEFFVLDRDEGRPTGWKRYGEAACNVYVAGLKGDPDNVPTRTWPSAGCWPQRTWASRTSWSRPRRWKGTVTTRPRQPSSRVTWAAHWTRWKPTPTSPASWAQPSSTRS